MSDEYADLASWVRPKAALAMLGLNDATMVTVTHITRTQIVCVADSNKHAIYRFHRELRRPLGTSYDSERLEHELIGDRLVHLARRDHTEVIQYRVRGVMINLGTAIRAAVTPKFGKDPRSQDERAMETLDALENLVRKARRRVESLIDPGGLIASEFAQELEQVQAISDLEPVTE